MDELRKDNIQDIYALSNLQEGIFFHYQLKKKRQQYFEQTSLRITGRLDLLAFEQSFSLLIKRYDILRTVFVQKAPHSPLQVVLKKRSAGFYTKDLRSCNTCKEYLVEYKRGDKANGFDLSKDPLIRIAVFQTTDDEFEVIWSHHHIILDGWCLNILNREFFQLYLYMVSGKTLSLPTPPPFKDYIQWLERQNKKEAMQYWQDYLEGYETVIQLGKKEAYDIPAYSNESYYKELPDSKRQKLNDLSSRYKITVSTLMQVAWAILLSRYNYTEDVVFGIVVSGRPSGVRDIENMVGLFINTVPLRILLDGEASFISVAKQVQYEHNEGAKYQHCQLADIQNLTPVKRNLVNHIFTFQNYPSHRLNDEELSGCVEKLEITNAEIFEQTSYNFNIRILPGDHLTLNAEYNGHVYDKDFVTNAISQYEYIIDQILDNETTSLKSIRLVTASDSLAFYKSHCEGPVADIKPLSSGIFSQNVAPIADLVAIETSAVKISYGELSISINRCLQFFGNLNLSKGRPAAVLIDRSVDGVTMFLSLLKASVTFVFLEPTLPLKRLKEIIDDSNAELLVSTKKFHRKAVEIHCACLSLRHYLCVDSDNALYEAEPVDRQQTELWDYVGSTATDAIALGRWVSSYTGKLFSWMEMNEYAENAYLKLKSYLHPSLNVLEIGCSSGLTMFKIAPHVKRYTGTDISAEILKKTDQEVRNKGFDNITLKTLPADQIDQLSGKFDLIILNSVIQNFNGVNYLLSVLRKAINQLSQKGIIFLGDIQDLALKEDLITSLLDFKLTNTEFSTKVKTDWSNELFLSKEFLSDLVFEFPVVHSVVNTCKTGTIENELTRYRFDSVLHVDKSRNENSVETGARRKKWYGRNDIEKAPSCIDRWSVDLDGTAYIIYTSGTTGNPKGVQVTYKSLYNYISWANSFYFDSDAGNMPLVTAFSVDLTLTSILCPLSRGKTLFIFDESSAGKLLVKCLASTGIDAIKITPTHVSLLNSEDLMFSFIRTVVVGGEALTVDHLKILRSLNPDVKIYNEYGPTEATVGCTIALIADNPEEIGVPIQNTKLFICDRYGNIVPKDCIGEILVGGAGLASGYINDPELTHNKFTECSSPGNVRIYKTGDIARWKANGNIQFIQRNDTQVKIRGYRVELMEIENKVRSLPGITNAIIRLMASKEGEEFLVAYYVGDETTDPMDFRNCLEKIVPFYMVPNYFVRINIVPLTASGKLNARLLPDPFQKYGRSRNPATSPENTVQEILGDIWREILELPAVDIHDNFFEAGGHSLKATQMLTRIEKAFSVKIDLNIIFDHPTIKEISEQIIKLQKHHFQDIKKIDEQPLYELSHAQRRLWVLEQMDSYKISNIIPKAHYLYGDVKFDFLKATFDKIISRHEILRTVFVNDNGEPKQMVCSSLPGFAIRNSDLSDLPYKEQAVKALLHENQNERFDLVNGPLLRSSLVKLEPGKYLFLFAMHHIISDGWSLEILIREIIAIYNGYCTGSEPVLPALNIQYKDYTHWHNNRSNDRSLLRYWNDQFDPPVPLPLLPLDARSNPKSVFSTAFVTFDIEAGLKANVERLCHKEQVSLFMLLVASLDVLLYKYTWCTDIILGAPNAGRNHPDLENQIGYYLNILPLRVRFKQREQFSSLLKNVRKVVLGAFGHQEHSLAKILDDLRINKRYASPDLFLTGLSMQNYKSKTPLDSKSLFELSIEEVKNYHADTLHTLWFYCTESEDNLNFSIQYDRNVLNEDTILGMRDNLIKILAAISDNPQVVIDDLANAIQSKDGNLSPDKYLLENINEEF